MAKEKTIYTCTECGGTSPRWLGKCPHCNAWNTLIESSAENPAAGKNRYSPQFQSLAKASEVTALALSSDQNRTIHTEFRWHAEMLDIHAHLHRS